jgi:hypothetical protein
MSKSKFIAFSCGQCISEALLSICHNIILNTKDEKFPSICLNREGSKYFEYVYAPIGIDVESETGITIYITKKEFVALEVFIHNFIHKNS